MQPFSSAVYMCNDLRLVLRSTGAVNVCFPQHTVLLAQSPVLSTAFTHLFIIYLYINQNYPLLTFVLQIFFEVVTRVV